MVRIGAAVLFAGWLVSLGAVIVWGWRDTARPAGAIVVLGAAQYAGRPSPVLRARLDHAIDLWNRGLATQLVVTGGTGAGDTTSEAAVGRRYAMQHGVPEAAIVLEAEGRTTAESMRAMAAMMRAEGRDSVILVSDPFHMLRLTILARASGLTPLLSPTRNSPISASWREQWAYWLSESVKAPLALVGSGGN
ncbi:MAG: YdcF family protein [Gemmatimonadota bacterium]|nr:YdcF family protein [Gemmatimonadota bacterium]MDE3172038.1 YdcF family protein [Gemmatimonadota bacterium]MDE3215264.1 YdcF family protein [Gemmatimonadota bacterium]